MSDKKPVFHLPTKPYSFIDCINRRHVATGSIYGAMSAHMADYNGHYNTLSFNEYRQYYVGEYTWAGRNVFVRSSDFVEALKASIKEHSLQGRGACLLVCPFTEKDVEICKSLDYNLVEGQEDLNKADWYTFKHKLAGDAISYERDLGIPAIKILMDSNSEEEYRNGKAKALKH